jgi:hypothetical protein
MSGTVHILKLCVGAEAVEDLIAWQRTRAALNPDGQPRHVTRMWPRRADEVLNGGSIYWVFKGLVLARQGILRLDEVIGGDGVRRCGLVLDSTIIRTEPQPRRPFQGWRYLKPEEAPRDLPKARHGDDSLPPGLSVTLADLGLR